MARRLLLSLALAFATTISAIAAPVDRPLIIGMRLEPPHLDPTAGAAAAIDEVLYANVFEGLTRIDAEGHVVPGLATDWEFGDDGLSLTLTLRDGVTFHDGKPFNADVAKFSLDRARAPGAENAQPQLFAAIESVAAPDPTTLVIHLSRPDADLPYSLAWGDAVMVHPDSAETNKQTPVGTGPFRFERWRRGDRIVLVRNDDYWGEAAKLPRVEFAFVGDPTVALAALMAGDINAFPSFGAPETLPVIAADPRFTVKSGTTEGETIMAINSRRPPLDQLAVRQALARAVDRQALVDGAMYGTATPIGAPMPPHDPAYIDLTGVNAYDPASAKALLAEAGVENLKLTLSLPPTSYARRSGEIIASELREVGIDVTLEPVEWAEWLSRIFRGKDYDLTIVAHTEPSDIGIYGRPDYYFHVDDPRLTEILDALDVETDPAARIELLQEAQRRIADNAVNVFLFQLPKSGVWDARLVGMWENSPIQANDVTGVYWSK
ncbi:ABC transporter substrate-binding protein [Acuticoccus mangrovi]|uniref:ABC transporter substrate-binding protein n=1 Tax=Acuticoccus mangrovi TaxID=2796142 RepID=A0A934MFI8_9HYPH|nr:ABC transporter substrate-binding protein [Acuticoccus mangrovi]MBJ3774970.1 ABC transporter substrate-binding protein [Acuticoccus mangrovi]